MQPRLPLPAGWRVGIAVLALGCLLGGPALSKECKKGKKPCGDKCIPMKKVCKEAPAASAAAPPAQDAPSAPQCKKGKKPCGDKCIPAKKECKEASAPGGGAPAETKIASASAETMTAALSSQPGQAMLQLARTLQKTGDLDVDDRQRLTFRQGLRGAKAPLLICGISHVQLVRDCDAQLKSNVTLPCYLAVDEMAAVCKVLGQEMPTFR